MTYDQIVDRYTGWNVNSNQPSDQQLQISATVVAAKELRKATVTLGSLLNRLDALGADGIHEVIRHHARRIRKAEAIRRGKIAAKRRRLREARMRQMAGRPK